MNFNLNPGFLPKGTVVRVSEECVKHLPVKKAEWTVLYLSVSQGNGWLIHTGVPHPDIDNMDVTFNTSWVEEILVRGTEGTAERTWRSNLVDTGSSHGSFVLRKVVKFAGSRADDVDLHKLHNALDLQSFWSKPKRSNKRAEKWIKANWSRFLYTMLFEPDTFDDYADEYRSSFLGIRVTSEDLRQHTMKSSMSAREEAEKLHPEMKNDTIRRSEECISTVISPEEVDKLWPSRAGDSTNNGRPQLLDCGVTVFAKKKPGSYWDYQYAFLTDDCLYGLNYLKDDGWLAMTFMYRGTAHVDFSTWREHVVHYYPGAKVLNTEQELLDVLNGECDESDDFEDPDNLADDTF